MVNGENKVPAKCPKLKTANFWCRHLKNMYWLLIVNTFADRQSLVLSFPCVDIHTTVVGVIIQAYALGNGHICQNILYLQQ